MARLVREMRGLARDWRWFRRPLPPAAVADEAEAPPHWRFPTRWARSRPAGAVRTFLQSAVLHPLLRSQLKVVVEGRERVAEAADGPVILAPNHSSHLDAPLVLTALPPQVRRATVTLAASDYFFDAWWRAAATALVFNAAPIDRILGGRDRARDGSRAESRAESRGEGRGGGRDGNRDGGRDTLPTELLETGHHLLIFPEGTRSQDGYVSRFRHGAAHLAAAVGVPVVPVAIQGTWRAMPRGQAWPSRGRPRVRVAFGPALVPESGEPATELTGRLEEAIAVLLDEQRTDWWTALRNAERGRTPSPRGPSMAAWRRRWALLEPDPQPDGARRRVWANRRRAS